ncbi:MAG: acyl-CoA thioesterase [Bacteroidales bacterium]|jgi:acyl-CoA thioester hydrolase|nr:acyl-CoA thioesterase [Bacteroidales bacterium]
MLKEQEDLYKLEFRVRDYECDLQGVVNNANYQHYLEHARHEFLISKGISFSRLHDEGIDLIVTKVEIEYKFPLRSTDRFMVTVKMAREGNVRIVFFQEIYRITDEKLIVKAKITTAATRKGKPFFPAGLITEMGLD